MVVGLNGAKCARCNTKNKSRRDMSYLFIPRLVIFFLNGIALFVLNIFKVHTSIITDDDLLGRLTNPNPDQSELVLLRLVVQGKHICFCARAKEERRTSPPCRHFLEVAARASHGWFGCGCTYLRQPTGPFASPRSQII